MICCTEPFPLHFRPPWAILLLGGRSFKLVQFSGGRSGKLNEANISDNCRNGGYDGGMRRAVYERRQPGRRGRGSGPGAFRTRNH